MNPIQATNDGFKKKKSVVCKSFPIYFMATLNVIVFLFFFTSKYK